MSHSRKQIPCDLALLLESDNDEPTLGDAVLERFLESIQGSSLESVSSGFLSFLRHLSHITLSSHHVWELPAGVSECSPFEFRSLLKQEISFEV